MTDRYFNTIVSTRWLWPVVILLVIWAVLVAMLTAIFMIVGSLGFIVAFELGIRVWVAWLVCAPFTIWIALKYPIDHARRLRSIVIHLVACVLVVTVNQIVFRQFDPPQQLLEAMRESGRLDQRAQSGPPMARAPVDMLFYVVILSICQAVQASGRARERERRALEAEAHLAQARLQSLQMQLNPHFLFNALNAITAFVHSDPDASESMLTDLSELLRASLASAEEVEIPLRKELEFLDHYLAIEQTRFGDRLKVEKEINASLLDVLVPTLILQPLVENAVRHGIEPLREGGLISLRAQRDGDALCLTIRDNGVGFLSRANCKGVGLTNTQARLIQLYPDSHTFDVRREETSGCVATIRLPLNRAA